MPVGTASCRLRFRPQAFPLGGRCRPASHGSRATDEGASRQRTRLHRLLTHPIVCFANGGQIARATQFGVRTPVGTALCRPPFPLAPACTEASPDASAFPVRTRPQGSGIKDQGSRSCSGAQCAPRNAPACRGGHWPPGSPQANDRPAGRSNRVRRRNLAGFASMIGRPT